MSPETFLALATLGSTAFTFTLGFIAGRAWAAWRVRRQAAQISTRLQAARGNWNMLEEGTCIHGKGFKCVTCWPHPAAPSATIGSSKEGR
ncbi:hypothetical protein [uncultured Pseudacidovorax sp.]|uniref:hypothetical protein n=1 Tax=uncultured Pseudacidovorax sp. TaxID=679313 RepID=UPI0025E60A84|nr:hypothetical protein [uncultured Pseudacidovorax sp.]